MRVWEGRGEVGGAARVGKPGQRGFYARIEWAGMLRVWERCGAVGDVGKENLGGRLRAALAHFSGKKQKRARSARRAGRGEVGGAAPVGKIGQGGFYA